MFDHLMAAVQDLLQGRLAPTERRAAIADMKRALTLAKMGISDLRDGVGQTRARLEAERTQLATVQSEAELSKRSLQQQLTQAQSERERERKPGISKSSRILNRSSLLRMNHTDLLCRKMAVALE